MLLNGAQKYYIDKFRALSGSLAKANVYNNFIGTAPRALLESIMLVLIALLAFFMSVREGGLNHAVPYLGILALGGQKIMPQLQQIYMGWNSLLGHKAAMIHILELLDQDEKLALSTNDSTQVLPFKQSLCIENISFKYTGVDEPVLHNVNLTIKRGERIGFIGKTGSGKSTLIDIIMGLLEPTSGQLNVDSTTITPDNMRLWQNLIAQVPQSLFLSDTTIAENIAFGQEMNQIDMDGVIRAAQGAQLYDFIESLPESFQTVVGERGVRLSGGQRQRIGLARALYKKSQILILDEATSALDDSTEESVMQSLNSIDKNITILMIAHRLSTLKNCDRIVEIDNGRISQILSYEDVFKRSLE